MRQIAITAVAAEGRITCSQYLVISLSPARAKSTGQHETNGQTSTSTFQRTRLDANHLCVMCAGDFTALLCVLIDLVMMIFLQKVANPGFTKVITVLARRRSKFTGNTVLFVGTSDAGKTAILSSVSLQLTKHPVGCNQTQMHLESCGTAGISSATTHTRLIADKLKSNNTSKRETAHPSRGHPRTSTYQGPIPRPFQ